MIRRLGPADVAAYRTLRLEALRSHPEAYSSSFEDELKEPTEFFARRIPSIFGCFVGDTLVGTASLVVATGLKLRHKGLVVGVFLDPAHRGRGLARALMEAVIEAARADGLVALRLGVTIGNEPAERLYRALGFRQYGVEVDAIRVGGVGFDEALMALDLE